MIQSQRVEEKEGLVEERKQERNEKVNKSRVEPYSLVFALSYM